MDLERTSSTLLEKNSSVDNLSYELRMERESVLGAQREIQSLVDKNERFSSLLSSSQASEQRLTEKQKDLEREI